MEEIKPNEYRCESCGGVFEKGWTDEEAIEEANNIFPLIMKHDQAIVCDDCFNEIMKTLQN